MCTQVECVGAQDYSFCTQVHTCVHACTTPLCNGRRPRERPRPRARRLPRRRRLGPVCDRQQVNLPRRQDHLRTQVDARRVYAVRRPRVFRRRLHAAHRVRAMQAQRGLLRRVHRHHQAVHQGSGRRRTAGERIGDKRRRPKPRAPSAGRTSRFACHDGRRCTRHSCSQCRFARDPRRPERMQVSSRWSLVLQVRWSRARLLRVRRPDMHQACLLLQAMPGLARRRLLGMLSHARLHASAVWEMQCSSRRLQLCMWRLRGQERSMRRLPWILVSSVQSDARSPPVHHVQPDAQLRRAALQMRLLWTRRARRVGTCPQVLGLRRRFRATYPHALRASPNQPAVDAR